MGLKWSPTNEASSNARYNSHLIIRRQELSQLRKWIKIESYASNSNITGHSKCEQETIKTLEQTNRITVESYKVGLLWREAEVKLPNNIYSAMRELKSLERRLQEEGKIQRQYQETIDTDFKAGSF